MSYSFNGSNSFRGDYGSSLGTSIITIGCWVKIATWDAVYRYIAAVSDQENTGGDYTNQHMLRRDNVLDSGVYDGVTYGDVSPTGAAQGLTSGTVKNTWTPVVFSVSATNSRQLWAGPTYSTYGANTDTQDPGTALRWMYAGAASGLGGSYLGLLAELAIWTSALSQADRESYMDGTSADQIDTANLKGYWFKQGQENANDNTANGWDLTNSTGTPTYDSDHPTINYGGSTANLLLLGVG